MPAEGLQHLTREQLLQVAQDPGTSPQLLEAIAKTYPDDEAVVKALLANSFLPYSVLVGLSMSVSSPAILELLIGNPLFRRTPEATKALFQNPNLTPELLKLLIAKASSKRDEQQKSLAQRIKELTTSQKIALAKKGNKEARMILIKDQNEVVALEVVSSPRITEAEILAIAQMRDVSEKVLRAIANDRRYRLNKQIVLSLLHNPKTPVGASLSLGLPSLSEKELGELAKDRNIPAAVSRAARHILEQRKKPPSAPGH